VIKIQAAIRGYLVRHGVLDRKKSEQSKNRSSRSLKNSHRKFRGGAVAGKRGDKNGLVYARAISELPNYSNEASRQTEQALGPFRYDPNDGMLDNPNLVTRGPYILDNGAVYQGQWTKEGLRAGRGF